MMILFLIGTSILGLSVMGQPSGEDQEEGCKDPYICPHAPCANNTCKGACLNDYCGGCNYACVCRSDSDCNKNSDFCRPTQSGNYSICVPLSGESGRCGGFVLPWTRERCAPGLVCVPVEPTYDVPGFCRYPCFSQADCPANEFCLQDLFDTEIFYCSPHPRL